MTADPDARLGGADFPAGKRLPACFIEIGRRPGRIVTGAPDALLRRNGNGAGIFRLSAKDGRGAKNASSDTTAALRIQHLDRSK
jgi:hypothetical protein